jgi:prolipoprotein diacylglyceryl transferase
MGFVLSRVWKESLLNIMDLFFVAVPLGQAIGRWGNFFNSEAHGGHTDLPWAILVDGDTVHPAFLYESIWCLFLFFLLMKIDNHRRFAGQTFFLYMILYSVERFFVEGLRTDNLMVHFPFGDFRQAQVLSLGAIVAGAVLYVVYYRKQLRVEAAGAEASVPEAVPVIEATDEVDGALRTKQIEELRAGQNTEQDVESINEQEIEQDLEQEIEQDLEKDE